LTRSAATRDAISVSTQTEPQAAEGFAEAIRQFNEWRFYDCHETLEDIWRELGAKTSESQLANFYQGIIKAAAGYHHLLRGNYEGTLKVLRDTFRLLDPYRPKTLGLDVDALLAAIRQTLDQVEALGPAGLRRFDRSCIPTIRLDATA
jgi:predicted metal-dependent hydrolase